MHHIKYILTDLEGTTTSIHFVHEVLFPYFLAHLDLGAELLAEPAQAALLAQIRETAQSENLQAQSLADCVQLLADWCRQDRKHPALKALQGLVWQRGYERGELQGHFYEEVPAALARWTNQNILVGIYSSGSVSAQKLLVKYSIYGDLSQYFSNYFDTAVGHKREVASYQNIQHQLDIPAQDILFLSDITEELDAAAAAGFQTLQLLRSGAVESRHAQTTNFDSIF